ncbi:uncharacterized protein LOC124643011 [Helicoverpa zea]|uniref:uncharacterized protein LOC124643011 n=1 Tax=Helicoverpa zea TaxID=7113 RepID=UPI001F5A0358|nr:uncharacterized protein LOC124643011 [Helicoverpa zea]
MDLFALIRNILGVVSMVLISCPNESEGLVAISWPKGATRPVLWREVYYPYNMAVEPLMKRQESDVTDAPKAPKIQHTKTLPSEESVEYRPEQDFLDALNEDSSTMKTEEKACENCEGQNGEEEN